MQRNRRPQKDAGESQPAPAFARTATAAALYSNTAAINPRPARLAPSSRASQHATPNESNAAPVMRPTINAAGPSSDAPSNSRATSGGDDSSVKPIAVSTTAVTINSRLSHPQPYHESVASIRTLSVSAPPRTFVGVALPPIHVMGSWLYGPIAVLFMHAHLHSRSISGSAQVLSRADLFGPFYRRPRHTVTVDRW